MSNRELPMMPWFPKEFAAATSTWSFAERGAYRALLDVQWEIGVLPTDTWRLAQAIGMALDAFESIWPVVGRKFRTVNGGLRNERLEEHRVTAFRKMQALRKGAEVTNAKRIAERSAERHTERPAERNAERIAGASHPSPSPSPSEDKNSVPPERLLPGDRAAALRTSIGKINKNGHRRQTIEEPEERRLHKALQLLEADPEFPLHKLADMYHLSVEAIREAMHR